MSKVNYNNPFQRFMMDTMMKGLGNMVGKAMPTPEYKKVKLENILIPMRDGVKLSAVLIRPRAEGSYPVILIRNPYVANGCTYKGLMPEFAKRGYSVVIAAVRGAVNSDGEWLPFQNETRDGYDTIDWIANQPWCNGSIGGMGGSYLGFTQFSYSGCGHPALKTLFIQVCGSNGYDTFWRRGLFRQEVWTQWAVQMMGENRKKFGIDPAICEESFSLRPQTELGKKYSGQDCAWYTDWVRNDKPTDPYWSEGYWGDFRHAARNMRIPVMMQGGWFDVFLRPQMQAFQEFPEEIRAKSRFLIGPWNHGGSPAGDMVFPNEANGGMLCATAAFEWFEYMLKGKAYPHKFGVIEAYQIQGDRYVEYAHDLTGEGSKIFHLAANGCLGTSSVEDSSSVEYTYDPQDPVPTICGNALGWDGMNGGLGPKLQRAVGERADVISFVSEPLEEELNLSGKIHAKLFVSSDAPATAFTVCVSEVGADGKTLNIRDDITDIRWRDEEVFEDYTPGEIVCLDLDMIDITWKLRKGSCIRVDISSSNFPMYHTHFNSTEPWYEQTSGKKAKQKIFCGGEYDSCVILPIKK